MPPRSPRVQRRRFLLGAACGAASGSWAGPSHGQEEASRFDLTISKIPVNVTGHDAVATVVNGMLPAPTLRFRHGQAVTVRVRNLLREPTSLHWHGLRLPAAMDGVPGLSFRGIMPGEMFTYRFPIVQTGTYWYHGHSGMQEQTGLYGALILEADGADARPMRDHVILLSDWTDEDPMSIVANLKQESDYYNTDRPSLADLTADAERNGAGSALARRLRWEGMRMSPTDIMDVTGRTYSFLVNGRTPAANYTALFTPGEAVRLRFINASSMTTFDVRIPGLAMRIVAADGSEVEPIEVDEFRIGVAETYDAILTPRLADPYTIFAQAQDRSGFARATLAPRAGMQAPVPDMDTRPVRSMADMGMRMHAVGMNAHSAASPGTPPQAGSKKDASGTDREDGDAAGMDMAGMAMGGMDMKATRRGSAKPPADPPPPVAAPSHLAGTPDVDNVAAAPAGRLAEAGDGLPLAGRRTLTYADLKSPSPKAWVPPRREIVFHLTGNMERWIWGFDGKKFSEAGPVRVALGERLRFVLINDTMMEHPIHLHGFLFELENGQGDRLPSKHTVNVKPGERAGFVFDADTPGHWAFHCHLLYHMETGMFRTILVT